MPRAAPPERPARRRPGRPAVAPDARRSSTIGVSVSATEAAQLKAVAARVGLKPGTYLRVAALGVVPRIVPEGNQAHWRELARLTGALTQLFDARKQGLPVTLDDALVDALRAEVRALRQALLGQEDRAGWTDPLPDARRRLPDVTVDSDAVISRNDWGVYRLPSKILRLGSRVVRCPRAAGDERIPAPGRPGCRRGQARTRSAPESRTVPTPRAADGGGHPNPCDGPRPRRRAIALRARPMLTSAGALRLTS